MLKVSPMKSVMRFEEKGKLSPRFIGPYKILSKKGKVAYELDLPLELSWVHLVLRKCLYDKAKTIPMNEVEVNESLMYKQIPIEILDRKVHRLRTKDVSSLIVFWHNHNLEEATCKAAKRCEEKISIFV